MTSQRAQTMTRPANQLEQTRGDDDWRTQAKCVGMQDYYEDTSRMTTVRAICADCPVKAACVADALAARDFWLPRGGLTPDELRSLATKKPRAECGTESGYGRHIKAKTPTCAACRSAHNAANLRRLARKGRA